MSDNRKFRILADTRGNAVHAHFNFLLHPTAKGGFTRPLREEGDRWEGLSDDQRSLVRLVELDGATYVHIGPYEIWVEMGELFSLDDLEAKMRELFISFGAEETTAATA